MLVLALGGQEPHEPFIFVDCWFSGQLHKGVAKFILVAVHQNAEYLVEEDLAGRMVGEIVDPELQGVVLDL